MDRSVGKLLRTFVFVAPVIAASAVLTATAAHAAPEPGAAAPARPGAPLSVLERLDRTVGLGGLVARPAAPERGDAAQSAPPAGAEHQHTPTTEEKVVGHVVEVLKADEGRPGGASGQR
ncbi:hypothetical protein GCM10010182_51890 [Actinomadura cremea]|nr:hypothetical protein GCM10010182_51890 [Actinomadura cremea]